MRRSPLPIAAAIAATALLPASAFAAPATSRPFSDSYTASDSGLVDDCTGATGGVLAGSGTVSGRITQMNGGEVVNGIDSGTLRIDFSDGSSFVGASRDRFSVVSPPGGTFAYTVAHEDHGVSYAADGSVIASAVFRATEHTTITRDGAVRVSFERGRLTCS